MIAPHLSYVCTDRGIPVDGTKGASVHFRELGRALSQQNVVVDALVSRRIGTRTLPFAVTVIDKDDLAVPSKTGLVSEIESFAAQGSSFRAADGLPVPNAVYERLSLFGFTGLRHAKRHGVPLLLEVNAPLWEEAARFRGLENTELARAAAIGLMQHADQVFAVSPRLREQLIEEGVDPTRVEVLLNGVSQSFVEPGQRAERPTTFESKPLVVFVGSLKPWHGVEFLLDALLADGDSQVGLWIVGDGPLRERVEFAAKTHPDRVHFEGAVSHERVADILRAADVAVAPYSDESPSYFCPLKVLEALCVGTPLVASSVPAVREIVPTGAMVHTYDPDDGRGLREAIGAALRTNRSVPNGFDPRAHSWSARARRITERAGFAHRHRLAAR